MRYIAATALLALGLAASLAPAFAASEEGADTCYAGGAADRCIQPAVSTQGPESGSGTVAGPTAPDETSHGGDRN